MAQRYPQNEQLYVSDPRALHHIVVKEQDVYEEPDMFIIGNRLIFGEGLISTLGEQHRKQRKMLNPVFSMGNMRDLLPTIQPIASQLCAVITSQLPSNGGKYSMFTFVIWALTPLWYASDPKEIDLLPLISRGALEYVAQAVLGYSFGALDSSETVEYAEAIRSFTYVHSYILQGRFLLSLLSLQTCSITIGLSSPLHSIHSPKFLTLLEEQDGGLATDEPT